MQIRLLDQRRGDPKIQGMLAHPLARALLTSRIKNQVNKVRPGFFVLHGKDVTRDFNQIAFQFTFVPITEDLI